jgi:hypothetical protein
MRRPLALVSLALVLGAALAATVFWNDAARATSLAPPPFSPAPGTAIPGHALLIADDLVIETDTSHSTPWHHTGACERMILVVRGIRAALVEFYTSMDGAVADTWWTDDNEDNFNLVFPGLGTTSWTFSFSFHGLQPAAAPRTRVVFHAPDGEPAQTVDKAWIYCVG